MPALFSSIALSNVQSLIQLSIALNAAYFTFRSSNRPAYDSLAEELNTIENRIEEHQLYDVPAIRDNVVDIGQEVQHFAYVRDKFYSTIDYVMLYFGYGFALVGIVLLLICSLLPEYLLSPRYVLAIFFILYVPVSLSIIMEIALGTKCWSRQARVTQLRVDCEYAIAQVQGSSN